MTVLLEKNFVKNSPDKDIYGGYLHHYESET